MIPNQYLEYDTPLFVNVFNNAEDFLTEYKASGLYDNANKITDANAKLLFYLLYAKYGNNAIANYDVNQFKYKMWSILFTHGPAWERKLSLQSALRSLSDDELLYSSKTIVNHAANPDTDPSTDSLTELTYINSQDTSQIRKNKLSAYMGLWEALKNDVTNDFLNQFKRLFKQIVYPERPIIYESEE